MGSIHRIDNDHVQNRALLRENGASDQYPVSCRLYSKSFPEGISAEVINYHYAGACLKFQDSDIFRVKHIIQFPLSLDFFLGSHLLKSDVAVRVAWHETSLPNFLGLQFLVEARDFIERSRRYKVNETYQPTISAKDPLDVHRTVYFKVKDFSAGGLLLNTSLSNKHLFPGMILKHVALSIPGQDVLHLDLKIENARKGDLPKAFDLGVSIQNDANEYMSVIQTYMNHLVQDAAIGEGLFSDGASKKKVLSGLSAGLTFRIVSDQGEYEEVLKLRHVGYGVKGKVKSDSSIQDQGEGLQNEGTILGAYLGGKLVASMELRFSGHQLGFRVFKFVNQEAFKDLSIDWKNIVEMNKLVVHPDAQGSDVLTGMIQKAHAICMAKGSLDVLLFATDALKIMYTRIGARETGICFSHPHLKDVALHVLILTKESFLEGRFMKAEMWSRYFEETTKFYEESVFKNQVVRAPVSSILHKVKSLVGLAKEEKLVAMENFSFQEKPIAGFIDPKWTKPHILAPIMFPYLMAGDRLIGTTKIDSILSHIGIQRSYFKSQSSWISVEFLDAFLDEYSRYGSIDEVSKMSGELTFDKEVIGLNYYILKHFLSPEMAFRAMASTIKKFNLTRTCEIDLTPGRCIIKIGLTAKEYLPKHRCSDLNWQENLLAYIRVLTQGSGDVRQISSCYDGDNASIFAVTWPVRSEKAEKIANLSKHAVIGLVIGAAVWPFASPLSAILAAALGNALVVAGQNMRARKIYLANMAEVSKQIEDINEEGTKKYMDLQDAKQRLDKRYHEAQILDESARLIQSCDDIVSINRTALKTVCTQFGFTRAFIMVTDEDGKTLKTVAIDGVSENSDFLWQFRVDVSTKRENALFLSSAFHSGQAVVINDLDAHIFQLNEQSQNVIKSIGGAKGFTIIPIPDAKGSCGVLIAERDTEKCPIRQEDVVVLQRLCQHIGIAMERFGKLEKEQKLRTLFQKYVPQAVLDSLLSESNPMLGGVQKDIVCMFLDIRGFTHMSATLPPKVVIDVLNRVFTVVGHMVEKSGGVIDKFLGDGLLAVWGTIPGGKSDVAGIITEIQKLELDLGVLNKDFETQGLPSIQIGIGLHRGPAIVGNIGSVDRLEFTCIGQAVNLASRLEGLCKQFNTNLVLSEQTFPEAADLPTFRRVDDVEIRGLDKKISIFVQDASAKIIN